MQVFGTNIEIVLNLPPIFVAVHSDCRRKKRFEVVMVAHCLSAFEANDVAVHQLVHLIQVVDGILFKKPQRNTRRLLSFCQFFVKHINKTIFQLLKSRV